MNCIHKIDIEPYFKLGIIYFTYNTFYVILYRTHASKYKDFQK